MVNCAKHKLFPQRFMRTILSQRAAMFFTKLLLVTFVIVAATTTFASFATESSKQTPTLRIAVAANFAPVMKQLVNEFTAQTKINTSVIVGSSGALYQQIYHGAPFDMFFSADQERPTKLANDNLIVENSLHTYAVGQLALWSASTPITSFDEGIKNSQRFAIANPKIAPYGKAAKEALVSLNQWQQVRKKLVTSINVNQTFQQVRSKAVHVGIVANSQLVLNNLSGMVLPQNLHQPIKQQLVTLKRTAHKAEAKAFSQFILSEEIQQKIVGFGYQRFDPQNIDSQGTDSTNTVFLSTGSSSISIQALGPNNND